MELDTRTGRARVIGAAHDDPVDPAYYPEPQIRTFTGPAGRDIHAHIYPPHHPGCVRPRRRTAAVRRVGARRPHQPRARSSSTWRSPTSPRAASASPRSTTAARPGYGREYRNRLREQWGVVDVEDCAAVALALADEGTADRGRLAIRGGSAGGWTAAASLTAHRRLRLRHDHLPHPRPGGLGARGRPTTSSRSTWSPWSAVSNT